MEITKDANCIAYREILNIFKKLDSECLSNIPEEFIKFLMDNAVDDKYNEYSALDKEGNIKISPKAELILDYINYEYLATEEEKLKLKNIYMVNEEKIKEMYDIDNIFKSRNIKREEYMQQEANLTIIKKKNKFIEFLKRILRRKQWN